MLILAFWYGAKTPTTNERKRKRIPGNIGIQHHFVFSSSFLKFMRYELFCCGILLQTRKEMRTLTNKNHAWEKIAREITSWIVLNFKKNYFKKKEPRVFSYVVLTFRQNLLVMFFKKDAGMSKCWLI